MNGIKIRIKDTGLDKVGGSEMYSKVDNDWIELDNMTLRHEFTVMTSNNNGKRFKPASQELSFQSNEITGVQAPRLTLQGLIQIDNSQLITKLINLNRTLGIKRLSGGLGIISAYPEVQTDTYDYISVIIKNFTISEVVNNSVNYANITIQLEQVN